MMSRTVRASVPRFLCGLAALLAFGPAGAGAAQRMVLAEDFTATW
jgi:hypothetical protein